MLTWEQENEKLEEEANVLLKEYRRLLLRTIIQNTPRTPYFLSYSWFMHTPVQKYCLERITQIIQSKIPAGYAVDFVEPEHLDLEPGVGILEVIITQPGFDMYNRLLYKTNKSFFELNETLIQTAYFKRIFNTDKQEIIDQWFKDIDKETSLFKLLYGRKVNVEEGEARIQRVKTIVGKRKFRISVIAKRLKEIDIALSYKEEDSVVYHAVSGYTSEGIVKKRFIDHFLLDDILYGGERVIKFSEIDPKEEITDLRRRMRAIMKSYNKISQYQKNPEAFRKKYCQNLI